ncbi:leucine-rich repeat domain-containing protein [Anatilimnocola floriformis]|uniref:leucine-rich repeat domain-containing protein n=1 Tax=Anatilimnocola floriformis TaxID=2948575 RepID=UPI0020C33E32|nr:hypothetical protein [Anatilimnocola floriformis]
MKWHGSATFYIFSCLLLILANRLAADEAATLELLREFDVKVGTEGGLANAPVVSISLKGKKVTDAAVGHLVHFPELKELDLAESKITDAGLKSLKDCRHLQKLDVTKTPLSGQGFEQLSDLPELTHLMVTINDMTDAGMQAICRLPNLTTLRINGRGPHRMTLAGFKDVDQLEKLTSLYIDDITLNKVYAEFAKCRSLERLTIFSVGQISKLEWEGIRQITQLKHLTLNHVTLEDPKLPGVKNLTKLGSLALPHTNVGNEAVQEIKELTALRVLVLRDTRVTDAAFENLPADMELSGLHLDGTKVTDAGLEHLAVLKNLRLLQVRRVELSAAALQKLQRQLPMLRVER